MFKMQCIISVFLILFEVLRQMPVQGHLLRKSFSLSLYSFICTKHIIPKWRLSKMNVSLSHWSKNLGKLGSVFSLLACFYKICRNLITLELFSLCHTWLKPGNGKKILHKGHTPRLMCIHILSDGKKPCFQQMPVIFLKLQCRCGASPQAVELLSKVMCIQVQPHSEAKNPQVYTTVLRMICKPQISGWA